MAATDPRILYDLAAIPLASFEQGENGDPPTFDEWTTNGLTGAQKVEISTGDRFRIGPLDVGTRSLKMRKGAADPQPFFAHPGVRDPRNPTGFWLPPQGTKVRWTAVTRVSSGSRTIRFQIQEKDVNNVTQGSIAQEIATVGTGWTSTGVSHTLAGGSSVVKLHLAINYLGTGGVDYFTDHMMLGRVLDFDGRRFRRFRPEFQGDFVSVRGGGNADQREINPPKMRLRLDAGRIGEAFDMDVEVSDFLSFATRGNPFALWFDRSKNEAREFHFETCVSRTRTRLTYEPGPAAYDLDLDFETPLEFRG